MSRTRRQQHSAWRDTPTARRRAAQWEARFVFDEVQTCPMCIAGQHHDVKAVARALADMLGEYPPAAVKPSRRRRTRLR